MSTWIAVYDLHYPKHHRPTWEAILDFCSQNTIDGFVFGGDQFDNEEISPYSAGKGLLKLPGSFAKHTRGFVEDILKPLEVTLADGATEAPELIWITGNHDDWEQQLVERNPELQGVIERPDSLGLADAGWEVVPCGKSFTQGKLTFIHGETLGGFGNQSPATHSRKALDVYCTNVLYGHFHGPQSATKVLPYDASQKWGAWCSPIAGGTNARFLRNRPTNWVNGFTIIEFQHNGDFNLYPIVVSKGRFCYGGKTYGAV